ncbi:E3 ubiquitin-protein ligase rnf213-alpha-like isoform X2 [Sphaeramia orbicularis]|uniref:E3 ubiquitin-protein ligase rnf213-alpha-like isoform X2 n=1 Tax=Sphaeramia orbicularis TaxID=375764 RepID=UPI0011800671|nr:E3 ubiquitin-protein ligase rnf213-alpha-like isoform X2 [Sphaeramia orbicularis]
MKCPDCGHVIVEEKAKFCSDCGLRLTTQPANTQDAGNQPKPLVADLENTAEKPSSSTGDDKESERSSKRPSEETVTKKKKKRKKKNKKKKDGNMSSDQSDVSLMSMGDNQEKTTRDGKDSSDGESSDNAMDETPDSLQDGTSSLESPPSPSTANTTAAAAPSEDKQDVQNDKPTAALKSSVEAQPVVAAGKHMEGESNAAKPSQDQKTQKAPADASTQPPVSEQSKTTAPQLGSDKEPKNNKSNDQNTDRKNSKSKKDTVNAKQPKKDENANVDPSVKQTEQTKQKLKNQQEQKQPKRDENVNVDPSVKQTEQTKQKPKNQQEQKPPKKDENVNVDPSVKQTEQTKQKPKNQQEQKQKQTVPAEQKMVFGPNSVAKAQCTGSSVDRQVEHMEVQQSTAPHTSDTNKETKDSNKDNAEPNTAGGQAPKRPTSNKTIAAQDRLTIYFHAILSKDFKFDPEEDRIFIRAGSRIGKWEANAAELSVARDLGEHGFLVNGSLVTTKSEAHSVSIPYKYVVYRRKKEKYEYEYIYKMDSSTETTNRCLFVKPHLLNEDGDWHQYDDIICAEPSKNILKRLFWPDQKKNLIQGREIAGNIMLETIFDLLRDWNGTNLKSFLVQLNQFFQIYEEPYVYEGRQMRWYSLDYGKEDVKHLLKQFMLSNVTPQLLSDGDGKSLYIQDPVRAAVITLFVCTRHDIKLDNGERNRLCSTLCLPKLNKEDFLQYWTRFSQDVCNLPNLPEKLMSLINSVKNMGMPRWILVLPLLHLLKGTTKPFEAPTSAKYDISWAGLQGVQNANPTYMSSQDRKALVNLMKKYSYLMEVDPLMLRSYLYLMPIDDLIECSMTINAELLDMLKVFTNKTPQDITYSNFQTVSEIISHIQINLIEEKYSCVTEAYRKECLATAVKLLEKICRGIKPTSSTQNHPDIPVACMNLVASVSDIVLCNKQQDTAEGEREQWYARDLVSESLKIIRDWISRSFMNRLLNRGFTSLYSVQGTAEIEIWNNMISIHFKDERCTKEWRQTLTMDFEGKYKQESALDQIEFYCTKIEDLSDSHPHVASIIERCALEAVTSLCQTKSEGKLFERLKINWKFGKLISAIIQKSWPRDRQGNYQEDEEVVLQYLLSWTAAKDIFQLHGAEEKLIEKLSVDARDRLAIAISSFTAVNNQLICGNIKISLLKIILERSDAFLELLKIDCLSEREQYKDQGKMRRLLRCRQDEVDAVYHEKDLVDIFLTMSRKLEEFITVDVADMEERQQINVEVMALNHFMEVHPFDEIPSPMAGVVTYFQLDDEIRNMAETLYTFRDSHIFSLCWEKQARVFASEEILEDDPDAPEVVVDIMASPEVIHDEIFIQCFAEYNNIYTRLKNNSIRLEEVNQLFRDFKGKYEKLAQDMDIMCRVDKSTDKQWIHSRVKQIEQYHELHLAVASAEIIMMVKDTLCLKGDFRVLETLTEVNHPDFQKEQLNRIDNDLMQAKKDLVDITEPRRLCLNELRLRGHFVKWVKDALEDINELKVFVDLASISAGENDMDVDRVACFHDAVLGYSSMLYELKPDSDFHTFKEVLQKLWRALENDNNLPKKLRDSARHLEWLKTVKESHGSVELSSLSLASSINNKGIYLISAQNVKKLSLATALKLQIPEEHDDGRQMRSYSLEDLRELQNKLMLMSGKGDQGQNEVDHFAEVFDSVQRLAEAFIALHTAGNPLFRHWEAQISCSISSIEPSIMMDFNLGGVLSAVIVEGSVEEQLPELCRKMEKCLEYWMNFVDKQRSQSYYLNYYTAEQIVYLCSKLSQQNVTSVDDQVLMMLSFIKPDCTASDLRHVWHALQYEMLTKPEEKNDDLEFQMFAGAPLSEQVDLDFTSELDPLRALVEQASGLQKFDLIWNAYMKDMKGFLPHILDVKTLGRLLEILANKDEESEDESEEDISKQTTGKYIQRQLPNGLVIGNPNLIVCPHDEVLTSCISVYMSSENEALPTYDEVLLCSPMTPYEQVELFLRRCLSTGYRGQKIYSLLYGDLLTYDVSSRVETFFQRMKMQSRKDYSLVIICSSEREHAYLPSAFSQYKLHMVPQEVLARIQNYLYRHYAVPEDQSSAAAAFKDRLCVGVVSSKRAGVGKSLYIKRLYEKLKCSTKKPSVMKCIRLIEPNVDESVILQSLINSHKKKELTIFHFDITSSVQKGLHEFLFKLLILRYLMDSEGRVWKCNDKQLYLVEILEPTSKLTKNASRQVQNSCFTDVFPNIFCRPPKEVLMLETQKQEDPTIVNNEDPLMDDVEFRSAAFQRPYQYLKRFHNHIDLDVFTYNGVEGSHVECLQMLLMHCGIMDPSWAELRNFAWFLNLQLQNCETSVFCDATFTGDTLAGFKTFVVDFMILMAKDFATPSLSISDQSPGKLQMDLTGVSDEDLAPFLIRKRWETEPHPYIFFNDDHVSMTFIGFHLRPNEHDFVDAVEPNSGRVIKKNVMTRALYEGLRLQRVPFNIDFDQLPRGEKIERICNVLGIQWPLDPDETYELTTDNILKMLAIHMRFRCGIPVIIMGETGCGKTRLIKFLCELRRSGVSTENLKLVKVHGGTTSDMIYTKVREAETIASINKQDYGFDSVLFFDEANTTEAISSIKEVLCDRTVKGESLTPHCGLQIIAACNPYRKHTDEMIQRLESAGLGYRVRAEETDEKLGSIPLRQLVYRVQALPPSMIPLVWDFGQLNDHTERIYIQQIVQRVMENKAIHQNYIKLITDVLSGSQKYMRTRKDECSFVSLRDVERCMQAFVWFFDNHAMFFEELEEFEKNQQGERKERHPRDREVRDPVIWSLVMAVGVCYHACLENKDKYRKKISKFLPYSPAKLTQEISLMQDLLLSGVPMGDTIARNNALKENVFMMVLCIELRIPLFLVGKPGSSKSLSKTLVADAMQGQAAHSDLYKRLKQIHLVSFQCSPHSTPEGIINTFKQCGRFQEGKNLDEYISVVVLDEIGLAEDSPKMPLKTLHPLLEEGCIDDEPLPHKKVGFIGISNWALDPAKMNRGIFVSRGDPDLKELIESAKGICSSDTMILEKVRDFFQPFAIGYMRICRTQGKGFFGLRDYYSLIKMIFAVAKASQRKPNADEIVKAVLRNFSGKDDVDAVDVFTERLQIIPNLDTISTIEFVRDNIQAVGQEEECRYLLVLTKNYAALQILQQSFFSESGQPEIIFGSSFPKDQEYTQICRNINRVKICMETGQTVVLLNLQNLYESLYDALNQYYVCLGGQKYVDLGLGTHRVKCRVHQDFRLIVIEEREVVYKQFPIPLINRLEKHYLDIHTVLKAEQKIMVNELEKWVGLFVSLSGQPATVTQAYKYQPADVFIGYHSDTCASVVLQVIENDKNLMEDSDSDRRILDEAKLVLLKCATPDSVVRLDCTSLPKVESEHLARVYFEEQNNNCLADYILAHTRQEVHCSSSFTEVTTFSRLLTASDLEPLEHLLQNVELLSLQQFDTEHSFLKKIRNFLTAKNGNINGPQIKILIIQCDFDEGSQSANLIASAKYSSINEINKISQENTGSKVFVYFITRLPRMEGGTSYVGFHGGPWKSVHIDDLRRSKDIVSDIKALQNMTISQMFETKMNQPEAMEVDDELYMHNEQEEENALDNVLDTTVLVRSCVQNAVGMLRDQVESGFRGTRRVEILLTLLNDNDEVKGEFLQTVKKHLHSLLATCDGNTLSIKNNWVMKEASNIDALQEGGTFRQTLWKRVQAVVVPVLAQLVSVIDRDQNLDILLDPGCRDSVKRLWLDIFGNDKLLKIPQQTLGRNSETTTILVQNHMPQNMSLGCSMPFSWRIKDYLEELWVLALEQEGQTQHEFEEFFWKTPLGRYILRADQEMQTEFFHRYLQDFICMTMNVTCTEHLQLLSGALNCCVSELKIKHNATDTVTSLPWVHAAYHEFKNRMQNLSRMICIEPQVIQDLLRNSNARDGVELVLDVYTAFACVEYLEARVLDTDAQRQAWLRQVKKLQVPIELICSEDSVRHYGQRSKAIVCRVQAGWNRIFSLSLFVEHMLLGIEEVEKNLTHLVLEHTRRLDQILEKNSDLKTQQSFEAVILLLKDCKDGAVDRIFRFGSLCPVCMTDAHDPLCLPCQHIYCVNCIRQWLVPGQMYCPLCMQPVGEDFPIVPSEAVRILINQHAQFRKRCNAFFVDLVSTVCFKDNSPPCPAVILHLLSFLMVEANPVPILRVNRQVLTKILSPFDDSVDKNPVVRSVVLKLLLKYSFDEVKGYLQQYLMAVERNNILEETDKTELYSLYINCLEDSMFERLQFRSPADQQVCLQNESDFLTEYLQTDDQSPETATVEYLQQVARVRMDLDMAAGLLTEKLTATAQEQGPNGTTAFLKSVLNLCRHSGNDWYRVYLLRKISSQHGVEFVLKLLKVDHMRWIFPEEVLQQVEEATPIDQFLACGEDYKMIRNAVAKGVVEGKVEGLDETCAACKCSPQQATVYLLLSLYREVTTLYREANPNFHPKPEQLQDWVAYIQNSRFLTTPEAKTFAQAMVTNKLGPLTIHPAVSGDQCALVELTLHLAAVLLFENQGILGPLQQLAVTPANMQAAFLPTMPEDMVAVAQQALGPLQWYSCPNGHPVTIGECGQPMQKSRCVDCGAEIGGNNHIAVPGFRVVPLQGDRTQTGHILGDPSRRDNPDMLDTKSISPVPFIIVRMLTHMAMLLGVCSQTQQLSAIIKPPVADPVAFLLAHLRKDQTHLIRSLGKGADDTVSTVHLLISSFMEPQQQQILSSPQDNLLSTKEARNKWEADMSNIITPQLKCLDRQLKEMNTFMRADSRISASPIMKLMFGDPQLFLASVPRNSLIHGSTVWSCREKVSLMSLTHIVEQNDGRDSLPVLWRFLHREVELRLVKNLPDILTLQRDLVKKFQNITELTCGTIAAFLHSQKAVSLRAWYEKHIKIFLMTWNQLRVSLATNGEIKIPAELCEKDLDLSSDFKVLLPRRQGPGLCSTALVSYLIALHNDMIYCVDKHTGEETSYKVSPADLTDLHVIRYELERDLMPLVLSNTQYSIEKGQETLHEYDLPKIQQQILSRFLLGKPLITLNGIPTLVNRHDRNYEIIFKDVKAKVNQEPLQTLTLFAVSAELHSYSEVCEALSTVELALGFVAMTGGESHMQLSCYLEEVLQMGTQMAPHILKALSMCCLKHCVALWQLLASLKSENILRLKRDPFVEVSEEYKQVLGVDEQRLLTGFFSKNSADTFLLEMHEFLVLVLKKPNASDTYKPNWSLKVTMMCYMERKDLDMPPDVEELFPDEILLSQVVEAWKFIVTFKQERPQRQ